MPVHLFLIAYNYGYAKKFSKRPLLFISPLEGTECDGCADQVNQFRRKGIVYEKDLAVVVFGNGYG